MSLIRIVIGDMLYDNGENKLLFSYDSGFVDSIEQYINLDRNVFNSICVLIAPSLLVDIEALKYEREDN